MSDIDLPEGVGRGHLEGMTKIQRHASPLSLVVLGAILLVALSGFLGGGAPARHVAERPEALLAVSVPDILRNGEFFEMVVRLEARSPVGDLTLGVEPSLWADMTQNTMIPAAGEESYADGLFRFAYGPVEAGSAVEVKMDLQINPDLLGGTRGDVVLLDGERELLRLPVAIAVRP
ncbi:hypothetical protein [Aurantimonas sp. Leaf443]|uniref:hypothetical protein n=1 Tax=Aurantimonas sp. Leaf443 TaxID=1736378 RepID=UPI0006F33330|nr:hypothetical protein [Aurantimonas sp. Leaf443]KQT85388.1 hypothetical protein ASG48_09130 [Aurantimonas sp. Leaf443]